MRIGLSTHSQALRLTKKMDYNIFLETPPKHVWGMQLIFFISYAYQLTLANKTSFTCGVNVES
jgi:hypothetical protein